MGLREHNRDFQAPNLPLRQWERLNTGRRALCPCPLQGAWGRKRKEAGQKGLSSDFGAGTLSQTICTTEMKSGPALAVSVRSSYLVAQSVSRMSLLSRLCQKRAPSLEAPQYPQSWGWPGHKHNSTAKRVVISGLHSTARHRG